MSPEVYCILTVERGWSEDDYEAWVAHTLRTQLLDAHAAERRRSLFAPATRDHRHVRTPNE
jgi:hypothetical protein